MENFTASLVLQAGENKIYDCLTKSINNWWTEMFEGSAQQPGETFTIRFGAQVFKTMLVEELIPGKRVVWKVVDALIDLPDLENKKEWIHTRIVWDILPEGSDTRLKLTHVGLTAGIECYNLCVNGWRSFLYSLEKFVTTGVGAPFKLADAN